MTGRRRRCSPLPWIGLSLLLFLLPASLSQKLRLTALLGFRPVQMLARGSVGLPSGLVGTGRSQEAETQLAFYKDKLQQSDNELASLRQQLEMATGIKQALKDLSPRLLTAEVILPTDGSPWRKSLLLALGSRGGVQKGMLVLYNSQFVGRILDAGPWTSRVQLCTDPGFRVGAVAVPRAYTQGVSFEKRNVGVYEGTAGENGHLKWLTGDTPLETDALVLTTEDPLNGIPRGLILGRVSKLSAGRGAFPRVAVEPVVNFRALERVMLLVPPESTK
jgi:rod shape-determining protein MreC